MQSTRYGLGLACLTFLLALGGCADVNDGNVGTRSNAAWVSYGANLWPFTSIEICFQPYSESHDPSWNVNNPTYMQRTQDVRDTLEDALASVPNTAIELYGWGTCPAGGLLDGLRISVQDSWNGASSVVGYDPDRATGIALGIRATMGMLLHEFGHSLGFEHEFLRDDVNPKCTTGTGDGTQTGYYLTRTILPA